MEETENQHVKFPKDIEDAKRLGNVLSRYKDRYYPQVLCGVAVTYLFLQTFAIPGSIFLSIVSGYLFSFPVALLLVCLCSATGASFCYLLSYLAGRPLVQKYVPDRAAQWAMKVEMQNEQTGFFNDFQGKEELTEVKLKVNNAIEYLNKGKPDIQKFGNTGGLFALANMTINYVDEMMNILHEIHGADQKPLEEQRNLISSYKDLSQRYKLWIKTLTLLQEQSFGISKEETLFNEDQQIPIQADTYFEATGKFAQEIVNTYALSLTNKIQFEKLREESDKAFEQSMAESRKIEEAVNKLFELNAQNLSHEQILEALLQGLEALGRLRTSWKNLLLMFGEIRVNIQSSMQTALTEGLGPGLNAAPLQRQYLKLVQKKIYRDCFSASIHVYLIQKQSELYYKVSDRILMPALNKLNDLIGIDPKDTNKIQTLENYFEENVKNELPKQIQQLVDNYRTYFLTRYDDRIQSVATLLKTISGTMPEETQQSVENTVTDAVTVITKPFGTSYGNNDAGFTIGF